jgi:poly(3-hydroxybutyrate) depolymerase
MRRIAICTLAVALVAGLLATLPRAHAEEAPPCDDPECYNQRALEALQAMSQAETDEEYDDAQARFQENTQDEHERVRENVMRAIER